MYISITGLAHDTVSAHLDAGSLAVDATAGNGHDTLFLARQVNPGGRVFAFDIQPEALHSARTRIENAGLQDLVTWIQTGHEEMVQQIPSASHGSVDAILFNLGYLPGGDKARTTQTKSTLAALDASLQLLRPGGMLSVAAYPGHPEGARECKAVEGWITQSRQMQLERYCQASPDPVSPRLWIMLKGKESPHP